MAKSSYQLYKENQERAAREEAVARLATVLAGSGPDEGIESEAEREFWDAYQGMHPPELAGLVIQHKVGPYRIDFAIPGKRIGIEIDGYEYHSDRRTFILDRERQRDLEMREWRLIRFAAAEVFRNPFECVLDAARLVAVFRRKTRP
jgi:very-short-patch-repair endonuclease